jgi:hypothetical protein
MKVRIVEIHPEDRYFGTVKVGDVGKFYEEEETVEGFRRGNWVGDSGRRAYFYAVKVEPVYQDADMTISNISKTNYIESMRALLSSLEVYEISEQEIEVLGDIYRQLFHFQQKVVYGLKG